MPTGNFLSIMRHKRKNICQECFNALPFQERKGRVALPTSWYPSNAEKRKCDTCGREGIYLPEEKT